MQGRRLPDNEFLGRVGTSEVQPGDYGRELITKTRDGAEIQEWDWFVCCPTGVRTQLWVNEDDRNGNRHVVTEHEDGTISVEGSVLGRKVGNSSGIGDYHGWLRHGVWTDA